MADISDTGLAGAQAAAAQGRIFSVELPSSGRSTITDFDPAHDKLDLGDNSVHAYIVVDTPEGVAFMDPWSGREVLIVGVSLGQLTVDSFVPVENDHLRQDLSGALAWEHGIEEAPHTVYARSHEVGQIDRVAFDPATDVVDFRYYGSREQIYMTDGPEGVVIGNYATGQTLILEDVTVAELSPENFVFHNAQVNEDRLYLKLGFTEMPASQVLSRDDIPTVGTNVWPTEAGNGAPPSGATGTTYDIEWKYGTNTVLDFDPSTDKLDFKYFHPNEFTVAEVNGSVVISIVGQNQTYTLNGVHLADLTYANILAVDGGTNQAWHTLIDTAESTGPSLSVGAAQVAEGDAGESLLRFVVTLSEPAQGTVSVDYATLNGSALANSDYQATLGTLAFAPGETSKTIDVPVMGDTAYELDETLQLVLSSASGARIATGTATGTIVNDDANTNPPGDPEVSIADVTVAEGNDGAPHMMFEVSLSAPVDHAVTVHYATQDGTAKAGSDYEAQSGTVTFAPGQTTAHVHVPLVGDTTLEVDETFSVVLSAPSGATLADGLATGTIVNDDAAAPPAGGDTIAFSVPDDWGSGFIGNMTLTPDEALNGWTVEFDAPFDISNIWNAEIVSHVGDHYVVRNASWNAAVPADGAVSFGFQAAPGGGAATVSGFEVNGTPVGGPGPEPELPVLAVADAQVSEGDGGMAHLAFTVSLSEASDAPVSVRYATADGTATAASGDYDAASGTLTFAPGETTKTVHVMVNGDTVVEANETLSLTLSAPSGATLGDASATGAILNDDQAPPPEPPVISVSSVTVSEGGSGGGAADGWFSTSGNQIVDSDGSSVQIAGVNWFGFEGTNHAPDGLWTRNYQDMMDQMKDEGFNTIRLPFSSDMLHTDSISGIDYSQNPELAGLTPIEVMDEIVAYADEIGMKVILDHHRSSAGAGTSANGLWYDDAHSEAQWVDDWQMLAERYADNPAVIGADLHNEPYNGTWGGGGANDWAAAAERAGNAIGEVNPNWLIFVEGVGTYEGDSYWWGGNLQGVADRPIALDVANKLVYSAHDYGNSVYAQPWFQDPDFAENLPQIFDENWGYIYREGIAPVLVGEFGTKLEDPKDAPWLEALTSYMAGDFDNDGTIDIPAGNTGISWTYWSWNPNSGDTGGILYDDWRTVHEDKLAYLEPIQFDLGDSGSGGDGGGDDAAEAVFTVSLSHAFDEAVTVGYHTVAGTADAADFEGASGTLTFAPGETSKVVRIAITNDGTVEPDEHFSLVLTDAHGGVIGTAEGVATIVDDDVAAPPATLSIADARAEEGDAGAPGALLFTVHLSEASDTAVTVDYHTVDGTTAAGSDYQGATGTLTFAPGETEATIRVPLMGDATVENDERFSVVLSDAHGAAIADGIGTGTIVNDDAAAPSEGGDHLDFTVPDDWGSGFVGNMTLAPDEALHGWTVEFDAPFDISNIWNAEIVSHVGDHYVVRNASWNADVPADGSVSFGFQASPGGAGAAASGFTVNGVPVEPDPAPAASTLAAEPLAPADGPAALLADDVLLTASLSHVEAGDNAFNAEVTLHNAGDATHGWVLEIETPYEIIGVSHAEILARTDDGYILGNAQDNGAIGENGDATFTIAGTGRFDAAHFDILI